MTVLGSIQNIQSNIIGFETAPEYGFCRKMGVIDNKPAAASLGSTVYRTVSISGATGETTYGSWTLIDVDDLNGTNSTFDTATNGLVQIAVVIGGANGEAIDIEESDTADVLLLVGGAPCILRAGYLNYTGVATSAATANLKDFIELAMPSTLVDDSFTEFDGTYADVTSITN